MANNRRKFVYALSIVCIVAFALCTPGIIEGRKRYKAVEAAFSEYSHALVSRDYGTAYSVCGDEFKQAIPFEKFVQLQRDIESTSGTLHSINKGGTFVHGKARRYGSPMNWIAEIESDQLYEKGTRKFVCEFHLQHDSWKIYGCKEIG